MVGWWGDGRRNSAILFLLTAIRFLQHVVGETTNILYGMFSMFGMKKTESKSKKPYSGPVPELKVRDGFFENLEYRFRREIDCPVNSNDHLRLVLLKPIVEELLAPFVNSDTCWDFPDFAKWWNSGFTGKQMCNRTEDHADIVKAANKELDAFLDRVRPMTHNGFLVKWDRPYRVFETECFPAKWKVGRFHDDDNATCNYFRDLKEAQEEAAKRNERRVN